MLTESNRASWNVVAERQGFHGVRLRSHVWGAIEDAMTQARTEGENAGVQKAEQAADGEITRLEGLLVAALAIIPGHLTVGALRQEKTRQDRRREGLEAYADRKRRECEQAQDRVLELEKLLRAAEAKLTKRTRTFTPPIVSWVYLNSGRVRLEDLTDEQILETWPGRNPAEVRTELDDAVLEAQSRMGGTYTYTIEAIEDDGPGTIPAMPLVGELSDEEIREFWPEADPDDIREQYRHLLAMADAVAKGRGGERIYATTDEVTKGTEEPPTPTAAFLENTPLLAIARHADHIADRLSPGGEAHAIRALSRNIHNLAVSAAGRLAPSRIQEARDFADRIAPIEPNMIVPVGFYLDALKTLSRLVAAMAAAR